MIPNFVSHLSPVYNIILPRQNIQIAKEQQVVGSSFLSVDNIQSYKSQNKFSFPLTDII
jgi:hypothetical protein